MENVSNTHRSVTTTTTTTTTIDNQKDPGREKTTRVAIQHMPPIKKPERKTFKLNPEEQRNMAFAKEADKIIRGLTGERETLFRRLAIIQMVHRPNE